MIVTEDDADLRDVLVEALRQQGYDPISATTLEQVQDALGACADDVLLLDLELGAQSGLYWLHTLCALGTRPRTVILSGRPEARTLAQRLGVGFLEKPFALESLCEAVQRATACDERPSYGAIREIVVASKSR